MNNINKFKSLALIMLILNICILLFLMVSIILALSKIIILNNLHFVVFVIAIAVNLIFIICVLISLFMNKHNVKRK